MTSLFSSLLYTLLLPLPPKETKPTGAPPTLQFVKCNDSGNFEHTVIVTRQVPVQKVIEANVNGKLENRKIVDYVPSIVTETRTMDAKNVEVYDLDGNKVDASVWQKILSDGAVVVLTQDGILPHPGYRKVLKAGTLVLVAKTGMPLPIPAPLPKTPAP